MAASGWTARTNRVMCQSIVADSNKEERIEKYRAWIRLLEERIQQLGEQRKVTYRVLPALLFVSLGGFFFGRWFGVGTVATAIFICFASTYLTTVRGYELREELKRTQKELERFESLPG